MRIIPEKSGKFSGDLGEHLGAFLKPLALKKHRDASA
jgi:hypothetical protein